MQAQCPQCATRIQIDDTKIPEKPFKVRCPKCQNVLTLAGRTAADAGPAAPPAVDPAAVVPSAAALDRRERLATSHNDALVALTGPAASHVQQALTRLGFNVDTADDIEEGARLLEQGAYEVAVTSRTAAEPGKPETLAQRILRLPPESRRRVFVILVGDEFRSADGTLAWAVQADLLINTADAPRCETFIRATMAERKRLYQPFLDARQKVESE